MNLSDLSLDSASLRALDATDPLAEFRGEFVCDDATVYLKGNSLGPMPRRVPEILRHVVEHQWAERRVRAWNEGWYDLPLRLGSMLAEIVGAQPNEVLVADSTSVNLYKLIRAAMAARPDRRRLVTTHANFSSDLYVMQGLGEVVGIGEPDEPWIDPARIEAALDKETAVLCLSLVEFRSAQWHDLARLSAAAHEVGALVLWDLSHAAGAVPIDLSLADLAVGCGYKYLCGGPGAPAFLYVRESLQAELRNPIQGWFGHESPFAFAPSYAAAEGMQRWLAGTPPIVSMACLEAGLSLIHRAGMAAIREKSERMVALFEHGFHAKLSGSCEWLGPTEANQRGSHVVLGHPEAQGLSLALAAEYGVVSDYRRPHHLRLGFSPLSNTYEEVGRALAALTDAVATEAWTRHQPKGVVT